MTNRTKKIVCATLASTLCLGVGLAVALSPVSASADSYAQYGNSYVSGLGIQPTVSAVLYEAGSPVQNTSSYDQYRTNIDGYVDSSKNYYANNISGVDGELDVEIEINYANNSTSKSALIKFVETSGNYFLNGVSLSSCMPSSPRFIQSWQWECWQSTNFQLTLESNQTYTPSLADVEAEYTVYTYVRGTDGDHNEPYLRSFSFPVSCRLVAGTFVISNALPDLDELIATYPEILYVTFNDETAPAGIMASVSLDISLNHSETVGFTSARLYDTNLSNTVMSYGNFQEYEAKYMEHFAEVNQVVLTDVDPLASMWNVVDGFFSAEIFAGFKIGDLLAIAVGSLFLGLFLKIFLGG